MNIASWISLLPVFGLAVACSSSSNGGGEVPATTTNAAVAGAPDTHCGARSQPVDLASCTADATAPAGDDAGMGGMGGMGEYGATLFGSEGDDDDCKYHVKWSSTDMKENQDVTFVVVLTDKADGSAARGAPVDVEAFLNDTHPAPNSSQSSHEASSAPGTYVVGPVRFDAPGRWTVRFHFHHECEDVLDTSPHGHAAFFVNVP